jgi:predicted secreted Zn-dependent protease
MNRYPSQIALVAATAIFGAAVAHAAESSRNYSDGPLTPADFHAPVPDPQPQADGLTMRAMTFAEIRYTTRYRWDESKPGQVTAYLTRFKSNARLLCDKCWIKEPMDLRLLAHEQGHFDITEIHARRSREKIEKLMADKSLIGHGHDERTAIADLDKQIHDQMQTIFDEERADQIEYDRATSHGRDFPAQDRERKRLDEKLKESGEKK